MNRRICVRTCSVAWCTKTNEECNLFSFPIDAPRAKHWEKALVYKTNVKTTKREVCMDHFEDKCFSSTLKDSLLSTAIPTRQIKIKEEKSTEDETSESKISWSNLRTSPKESANVLSEIYSNNEKGNTSLAALSQVYQRIETSKRKRNEEIEKTLEEYLRKRHLVYSKLKELDKNKEKPPTTKNYKFPNNLSIHKAVHNCTPSELGGGIQNVKSNSMCNTSSKSNKPKDNNVTVSVKSKEQGLKLMSSSDKSNEFESYLSNESDSNQRAFESKPPEKRTKKRMSKTARKRVEKQSSKAAKKRFETHLSKTSRIETENCVFNSAKEGVENYTAEPTESNKMESDVCIFEISDDYNSFGKSVAERLKKLKNPFVRIKALMDIQQVLLEAEYSIAEKK